MKMCFSVLGVGLALFFAGCATDEGPYVPTERVPSPEIENATVIMDAELKDRIGVDAQKGERIAHNKLKAMANVRNRTNQDLTIQAQTVFRDAEGFSLGDDTAWETVILTAHETRTITALSTTRKAERFTIRIRLLR